MRSNVARKNEAETTVAKKQPRARGKALHYERVFLERLTKAVQGIEKNYLEAGRLLSEAYHSGEGIREATIWGKLGFKSFVEFVEKTTGWSFRRGYALFNAYDFVARFDVPMGEALAVKSSKMAIIAAYAKPRDMNREQVMECIAMAKRLPWDQFVDWMQTQGDPVPRGKGGPVVRVMFLRFGTHEREWVSGILEKAKEKMAEAEEKKPTDISRERALETILREWAEMKGLLKTEEATMQ